MMGCSEFVRFFVSSLAPLIFLAIHVEALTFNYAGYEQSFTVPVGATTMTVVAYGAGGGSYQSICSCTNGYGALVTQTFAVTAGATYYVNVGGVGTLNTAGYNGGGTATCTGWAAGYTTGGSGATDIRTISGDLSTRIIVAGGGGGCDCVVLSGGYGGHAGLTGGQGSGENYINTVVGQTVANVGGYGGSTTGGASSNGGGSPGTSGYGGAGNVFYGAGGGGGYFGGGGGYISSGGGGSSYPSSAPITSAAWNSGNGQLTVTFNTLSPTLTPTLAPILPTLAPSRGPTVAPSLLPTVAPSRMPTIIPSVIPTISPTLVPTVAPTLLPSLMPTITPSIVPTLVPTVVPSIGPTVVPTVKPSLTPTVIPTVVPSIGPSVGPSIVPTIIPSVGPTVIPTVVPSIGPSVGPSIIPTITPSVGPTVIPTVVPSIGPSVGPSIVPTIIPSVGPTVIPTVVPSIGPSVGPSIIPTITPSVGPTVVPTVVPSIGPSVGPSIVPTITPSVGPTVIPTVVPSIGPSVGPSIVPTITPSVGPTVVPTVVPSIGPSVGPSIVPTITPSVGPTVIPTVVPSIGPSVGPSIVPTITPSVGPTVVPTVVPSIGPSVAPTINPSVLPTLLPSVGPTVSPSVVPTVCPSTEPSTAPTVVPTVTPSVEPSIAPTVSPTIVPSIAPSVAPTIVPSVIPTTEPSIAPTVVPSVVPTVSPSLEPSLVPTVAPTLVPTVTPTVEPSIGPTVIPSVSPSTEPSITPTVAPSIAPSIAPTVVPTVAPSTEPTIGPTVSPTVVPTVSPSIEPSIAPTVVPTIMPTVAPSIEPSISPTITPTVGPTTAPSIAPTVQPSTIPTVAPSLPPSIVPSVTPTVHPSKAPTIAPTLSPSFGPSVGPSTAPTVGPSLVPTVIPTVSPSVRPTDGPSVPPTVGPTLLPTVTPTVGPTVVPSETPSVAPSKTPTVGPSQPPSTAPSVAPSVTPTVTPSAGPSVIPSIAPTVVPTQGPTAAPSVIPSLDPTVKPSALPSVSPSVVPSKAPSKKPTVLPTALPTDAPTVTAQSPTLPPRSKAPSAMPTSSPSVSEKTLWTAALQSTLNSLTASTATAAHQSKYVELSVMQNHPHNVYGSCSSFTSMLYGDVAQSSVAYKVSELKLLVSESKTGAASSMSCSDSQKVSTLVSYLSSAHASAGDVSVTCDGHQWIAKSCAVGGSFSPAVCVDCADPCSVTAHCAVSSSSSVSNFPFTVSPCVSQVCATEEVSAMRILAVSFEDLEVAPDFVSLSSSASKTSISVNAKLSGAGTMYCGLYLSSLGYQPSSVDEIILQNVVSTSGADNTTSLTLSGLSAMTSYSVYCLTSSSIGVKMTMDKMLAKQQSVSTVCCKTVTTSLSTTVFHEKSAVSNLVSIALSAAPSASLSATITCQLSSSSDSSTQLLFPNSFSFGANSLSAQSSVYSLPAGVYVYSVVLSGSAAGEYEVVYSSGNTFTVLSVDQPPPAPKLVSATFAGDGSFLTISFDSSTNKGGVSGSSFSCSSLFDFACSSTSRCQWSDSATVQAQITESVVGGCAVPQSSLLLRASAAIKASCPSGVSASTCGSWQNATTSSPVFIQGPVTAVSPSVVISAPGVIGACDSLVIDITSSSGSGGRQWSNRSFVVQSIDLSGGNSSAVVQHFLNTQYQLSPPTAIPSRMFSVGSTYNFVVTLCNFLGKCSQNNAKVVVLNNILPSVSLPGQTIRTMTRSSALSIGSSAFVASCSGGVSSSVGLSYQWTVSENGVVDLGTVSASKDPSKMLLPAFSLSVNSLYQMNLIVTVASSLQSSSAAVKVLIVPGNVVARVSGGSSRSVRVGESVTIDASISYDEDVDGVSGLAAGLVFSWSCSQSAPVYSASCSSLFAGSADLSLSVGESLTLLSLPQTASAGESVSGVVVVTVQDAALKRSSTSSVTVSLLPAAAPVVSLVSNQASGIVNAGQRLQLTGSVSLPEGLSGNVTWSVVDSSFDLASNALAPVKSFLSAGGSSNGSHPVFMAFAANALPVGASLSFVLTCIVPTAGTSSSSVVTITVNAPPQLGSFQVSPESGVALTQPFTFAASQWVDSNLPITYQFGYYSNSGAYVVMQTQSVTSFGSAFLSAGLDSNGNEVTCVAQVFDALNANTSVSSVITVTPGKTMNSSEMAAYVALSLSAGLTSADSIKQAMALSSYVLNLVDCSRAPDCSGLNRQQCYKTVNTCGSCVSPFLGVSGDSNSQCVESAVREGVSDDECSVAGDCSNTFAECVEGHCVVPNKQCTNDCSGHGSCVFVNSTSSVELTSCSILESQCSAVCKCDSEYLLSSACDLTNTEVEANQASKELVLNSIVTLAGLEDPSEQVVSGWTSSISIATLSTDQLSVAGTATALDIVSTVLGTASQLSLSLDAVGGLLGTMDSITTAVVVQIKNNRTSSANSTVSHIQSVLEAYSAHAASNLVPGMTAVSSSYDQFSMSTQYMSASVTLTLPVSSLDALSGVGSSSVSLPAGSATVAVSMVSVHTELYAGLGSSGGFVSNPVSLMLSGLPCAAPPCEVNIVLQNSVAVALEAGNVEQFNTSCAANKPVQFDHECRDGAVMHLNCSGVSDYIMHSQCPLTLTSQVCSGLVGSTASAASGCRFVAQSSSSVTCACLFGSAAASGRRLLESGSNETGVSASSDGSYSASYVAMLSSSVHTFTSTFESAGQLNNHVAERGWKAIVTIGVFACAILVAILLSHRADRVEVMAKADEKLAKAKSMSQKWKIVPEKQVRKTMFQKDKVNKVVNMELALVEQSLPKVLSSSLSMTDRIKAEVKKHHRWFGVIFFYSDSFPRAFRVASLATNVIIMLFIQSITYNLTNPDDGSCAALSHTSAMACDAPKSSFATGQSKCMWDSTTDECSFIEPDGSIKIVLFVAIFSAIISTPIALGADWIMRNMVSAPVENANSVHPLSSGSSSPRTGSSSPRLGASPRSSLAVRSAEPVSSSPRGTRRGRFTMFPGADAKKRAETSLVSASHLQLTRLTAEIRRYREGLSTNEKQEFDLLWGLDEHGCFLTGREHDNDMLNKLWRKMNCFSKNKENKDVNVHQTVLADLKRIGAQTEDEIETFTSEIGAEGEVSQMSKETRLALGKRLLFLFQCDLLPGISGQILSSKGSRDYVTVKPVTLFAKVVGWSTVVLLNVGMLFYILLFALSQTSHRQGAWFQSFILWLIVEILFVSTAIVVFTHIFLPMLAMKDVAKIKQRLLDNIREFHNKVAAREHMDANERAEADADKPFNAAQYLFVSSRVAVRFPEVKEAQIIFQFSTPWPRQSYQHVADVSKNYDKKFSAVSRSASILVLFFLTSLLNVPPNFQDMIIHMTTTTSVGYTILLHIQLFDIFPVLAFGPFVLLCVMVHFWIRSGKAAAKAKLAKLMPSPVVQNRKQIKGGAVSNGSSSHVTRRQSVVKGLGVMRDLKGVVGKASSAVDSDDENDLQIEIDLKLPEVEDLVVPEDYTWRNFGTFVYGAEGMIIPPTPSCEPSVVRMHMTRRQSVVQGVQLLHQMRAGNESVDDGFALIDEPNYWTQELDKSGMNRVNSINSLEYDEHELYQRQQRHEDGNVSEDSLYAVSPMSFGDEL